MTKKNQVRGAIVLSSLLLMATLLVKLQSNQKRKQPPGHSKNVVEKKVAQPVIQSTLSGHRLIKTDGQIDSSLLALMQLYHLEHDGTPTSINQALQKAFLRKKGTERKDLVDAPSDQERKEKALQLLHQMGLVAEVPFQPTQTDYFLLFGGFVHRMEKRFADFKKNLLAKTLQCKKVIFLGGIRKLRQEEIDQMKQTLKGMSIQWEDWLATMKCQESELTEADGWKFVWQTHATPSMKSEWENAGKLCFVNSTDTTRGQNNRPTTHSTLDQWQQSFHPTPGSCHSNVENPYGPRMEKVLRFFLQKLSLDYPNHPTPFSITWNSPAAAPDLKIRVYLDAVARSFYQEYKHPLND